MSTETKHTNYKVVFEKNETRPCKMYISSGNRNLVASVNNDPETVAMFQLFAAAPEMLEALEALLDFVNSIDTIREMVQKGFLPTCIVNSKLAIKKAKGEQP
jgi:hypothetical protein